MKTSNKLEEQQIALATMQQSELMAINQEFEKLIVEVEDLPEVMVGDKDAYELAMNLKRKVKATHVAIEKRRKELKAPILQMGKNLDTFAKSLSEPLKMGEKAIKDKVSAYEMEIERIKAEKSEIKRALEEKAEKQRENLDWIEENMRKLIEQMKSCDSYTEFLELDVKLSQYYEIVGSLSQELDDAGKSKGIFAINQLRDYEKMKGQLLKLQEDKNDSDEEPVVKHDGMKYNPNNPKETLEFEQLSLEKEESMADTLAKVKVIPTGKVENFKIDTTITDPSFLNENDYKDKKYNKEYLLKEYYSKYSNDHYEVVDKTSPYRYSLDYVHFLEHKLLTFLNQNKEDEKTF